MADVAPKGAAQIVVGEATACLPLGSLIDLSAEKARIEKAIAKVDQEMARIAGKLGNEKFVANANRRSLRRSANGIRSSKCRRRAWRRAEAGARGRLSGASV